MISNADMDYINEDHNRLFTTAIGARVCEEGMKYFAFAGRKAAATVRIPELRDSIDPAVRKDILNQAYHLLEANAALSMLYTILKDKEMEAICDRVQASFCISYLECYKLEESLRRLCKAVVEYHIPDFKQLANEKKYDSF